MTLLRPSTAAAGPDLSTRAVRAVLTILWLVGVPVLAAVWANKRYRTVWGSIPAFWLDGDQAGAPIAGLLLALVVFAIAVQLHRLRAIFLLGVLPAVCAELAYLLDKPVLYGVIVGLVIGGLAFMLRRPRS